MITYYYESKATFLFFSFLSSICKMHWAKISKCWKWRKSIFLQNWSEIDFIKDISWEIIFLTPIAFFMFFSFNRFWKKLFFVFFAQNCHEKWVKQVPFSTSEFGSQNIVFEPKTCFFMWIHPKWFLNSSPKISLLIFESNFSLSEKIAVSSGQGLCQNKRC